MRSAGEEQIWRRSNAQVVGDFLSRYFEIDAVKHSEVVFGSVDISVDDVLDWELISTSYPIGACIIMLPSATAF